jgi:hypothetical protein
VKRQRGETKEEKHKRGGGKETEEQDRGEIHRRREGEET